MKYGIWFETMGEDYTQSGWCKDDYKNTVIFDTEDKAREKLKEWQEGSRSPSQYSVKIYTEGIKENITTVDKTNTELDCGAEKLANIQLRTEVGALIRKFGHVIGVLNRWKSDQGVYMTEEVKRLVSE